MNDRRALSKCLICTEEVKSTVHEKEWHIECPRCGTYDLTSDAWLELRDRYVFTDRLRANASGWLREQGTGARVDATRLEYFARRLQTPTVGERAEKVMRWLGSNFAQLSESFEVDTTDPAIAGVAWAASPEEVRYLVGEYLAEAKHYLRAEYYAGPTLSVAILPAGWEYLESLRATNLASSAAFVAMYFDVSTEPARDQALAPGISDAGYRPFVLNLNPTNRDLMDEVIAGIRRSRFVVADFSGNRHNVYFEAGLAQGLGIPVIHTCRREEIRAVTFDLNHYPFLLWEDADLAGFRRRLQLHIEATLGRGPETRTSA